MYIIGKTGMGKTTLIENLIVQDIKNGHGLAFLDPHGDSVDKVMENIPPERINDIIYFNPADMQYPIAFNILESVEDEYKHLVADGLMGVFTKIWANLWSARMEYILRNCILALLDTPGNSLLGIMRLLVDKDFRKKIVDKIQNPTVKSFWIDEYSNWNDRFRTEAIQPIQNKVGQFLSSSIIRNIVGQTKSTLDLRKIMDDGKILLMNLSKGKIGEDNSALLGAMMITKIQLSAMSRADTPEKDRRDFFLYVDELQNFATESFADILSEARKYHLGLVLGHQYIAQLTNSDSTKLRDAIFGNVGTMVTFRIGAADAYFLLKEFEPHFTEEDLVNINKYDIYLKLMIDGASSNPFSATTLPPIGSEEDYSKNKEKAIKVSRERYSNPKEEVEEKIIRWLNLEETYQKKAQTEGVLDGGKVMYAKGKTVEKIYDRRKPVQNNENYNSENKSEIKKPVVEKKEETPLISAICDNCLEKTELSFKPQAHLNVFCKKCLKLFKAGQINVKKLKFNNLDIAQGKTQKIISNQQEDKKESVDLLKNLPEKKVEPNLGLSNEKVGLSAEKNNVEEEADDRFPEVDLEKKSDEEVKTSGGRVVQPGQSVKL